MLVNLKYDYKDGELRSGSVLMDTAKMNILGRNIKQIIGVVNRADRLDGLVGGGIEMLIINYGNSEYGMIDMSWEDLTCLCTTGIPPAKCTLQLDGCLLTLDECILLLN